MTNSGSIKEILRHELRARRRGVTPGAGATAAQAAAQLFLAEVILPPSGSCVAGYYPLADEISPLPILQALRDRGYRTLLPVTTGRDAALTFRCFDEKTRMQRSAFGVMEPEGGEMLTPDILIVPLLGFDAACHRLGYGAGHYDRTLAGLQAKAVGLAFDIQYCDRALPVGSHDVALDCVVTDKRIYWPA